MDDDLRERIGTDWAAALAALAWHVEMGADEAVGDAPSSRYEAAAQPAPAAAMPVPAALRADPDEAARRPAKELEVPVADAEAAAASSPTLDALRDAMDAYPHCELKKGAKSLVFADGRRGARVMIIGEAPGRDEDIEGRPFVGRAGQLLDRMIGAIGLSRASEDPGAAVYITNVLPWRPPQNREPTPAEIAMLKPFLARHVALADPAVIVLMGNSALAAVLGTKGITRLRGQWAEAWGRPVLPMFHPAYLLRNPPAKREAWADLLTLRERLEARA